MKRRLLPWLVALLFLPACALAALEEGWWGACVHRERGYGVHVFTDPYRDNYEFRVRVLVQYDPLYNQQDRIAAYNLYVNGENRAQLGVRYDDMQVETSPRLEFFIDRFTTDVPAESVCLVPVFTQSGEVLAEGISLREDWFHIGDIPAYVHSEDSQAVSLLAAPDAQAACLATLYAGVRLQVLGPPTPEGYSIVYLPTIEGELRGYISSAHLVVGVDSVFDVNSTLCGGRMARPSALFGASGKPSPAAMLAAQDPVTVLGQSDSHLLVQTRLGVGLVAQDACTLLSPHDAPACAVLCPRAYVLEAQLQPLNDGRFALTVRLLYPERYTVNDDIGAFAVYVDGERRAELACTDPFNLFEGVFHLSRTDRTLLLVPVWEKPGELSEDSVLLPLYMP